MRRVWIVLLSLTFVSHVGFALGLAYALSALGAPAPGRIAVLVAAALALAVGGRLRRARDDQPIGALRLWLVEEPYYAHWSAAVLSSPILLVALPIARAAAIPAGLLALVVYLFALVVCAYGVFVRRRWIRVREVPATIAGLGPALDGYRIAQLSDLHIGGLWPRERAARWVRRVNALDVDLVALTGDYVTRGDAFHEDIAAVLGAMRAKDGVIAVMGNHDYFGDGDALVRRLEARGVIVLRNASRSVVRGSDALAIAGVDDTWTRRADVAKTLAGVPEGAPVVALAHDPRLFPELAGRGAALVLSGHTHWGQLAVPFAAARYNLSRWAYRYNAGEYHEGGSMLYVSPGLGTTGPPIRLGAAPEITVLTLRAPTD
jgi:predicted MPP superfamily phosphohydrolase